MVEPTPQLRATEQVSAVVDAHMREIVEAAERAAAERAAAVLADARAEAEAIRVAAEEHAAAHVEEARGRAAAFAEGRIARLQALTDDLLAHGEVIAARVPEAVGLRAALDDLVAALTAAAASAAAEAERPAVRLPPLQRPAGTPASARPGAAGSERSGGGSVRVDPAEDASDRVRDAARELPRLPRRPAPTAGSAPPPPEDEPA